MLEHKIQVLSHFLNTHSVLISDLKNDAFHSWKEMDFWNWNLLHVKKNSSESDFFFSKFSAWWSFSYHMRWGLYGEEGL